MVSTRIKGFTLIEVLVAISIMAFVLPALMNLMMTQADYAGGLRDRTIAYWIAENKANELRLLRTYNNQVLTREQTETVEMAGREWSLYVDIQPLDPMIEYSIKVGPNPDNTLSTLVLRLEAP